MNVRPTVFFITIFYIGNILSFNNKNNNNIFLNLEIYNLKII